MKLPSDTPGRLAAVTDKLSRHVPGLLGMKRASKYAVLVPLVELQEGGLAVLFEKRASTLRRQAGEICFPGGRVEESDESRWAAARRETGEELGLPLETIRYLGTLDTLVAPSQFFLHPFVGLIEHPELMHPNPAEVEDVFQIPLETLLATRPDVYDVPVRVQPGGDYPYHLIPHGENYPWRSGSVPHFFYRVGDRVIWGLTARILAHFLEVIGTDNA
jgi:coenzyme A diphosphatase NUDT7